MPAVQAGVEGATAEQRQDRPPRGERGEREGQRERGERGGRGRGRGERGPREQAPANPADEVAALAGAATSVGTVADMGEQQTPAADAVLESHTHQDGRRNEPEGDERQRRSRDRYGRDRRERQPRDETAVAANDAVSAEVKEPAAEERTERLRYPTGFVTEEAQAAPQAHTPQLPPQAAPQAPRAPAAQPKAPEPVARSLPKVQPFQLPVNELAQVAEGSGLQWVNSDAQKIAAVQAQIAAEPRPPRIPRERPAPIVIDEGPLVLVETKRDLQAMKLPFEQGTLPLQ